MTKQVEAVYEQGRLRPLEPLELPEGARLRVVLITEDDADGQKSPADILSEIAALPLEGSPIQKFHDTEETSDHDKFVRWMDANPDGFFLNYKSPSNLMLHRVHCDHLDFKEKVSLTSNKKLCSTNREELEAWVRERSAQKLRYCSHCKPI